MVNVLYSLSEFAKTLNLEHDSRIVPYALQLYTQASARTGTNSATPLVCLELAGEKYGTALDRRMTARLAGVTVTIYKSELMRLHDLLGISSNIMRITLKSLVVQFGSISMLPRCEQVMKAFKERWSASLPSAQLGAVQWDRAVFPVGVFLACCKVASVRVDRAKLRLMSGERAEEINKVITLTEYYAAEELKTLGLSNLHSQPAPNRTKDVKKTQTRKVASKASTNTSTASTSKEEPVKRIRKRASKAEDQKVATAASVKSTAAGKRKRKTKSQEGEEEKEGKGEALVSATVNEDNDEIMEEATPIESNNNNDEDDNDNHDESDSTTKTRRSTRQPRKARSTSVVKNEPSSPKVKRQRRKTATNNEPENSRKSSAKTNKATLPEDDNNERIIQLREPPVDGINPMILPMSWKETRQFAKAKDWKQKMLQKLRSSSRQASNAANTNEE